MKDQIFVEISLDDISILEDIPGFEHRYNYPDCEEMTDDARREYGRLSFKNCFIRFLVKK